MGLGLNDADSYADIVCLFPAGMVPDICNVKREQYWVPCLQYLGRFWFRLLSEIITELETNKLEGESENKHQYCQS